MPVRKPVRKRRELILAIVGMVVILSLVGALVDVVHSTFENPWLALALTWNSTAWAMFLIVATAFLFGGGIAKKEDQTSPKVLPLIGSLFLAIGAWGTTGQSILLAGSPFGYVLFGAALAWGLMCFFALVFDH